MFFPAGLETHSGWYENHVSAWSEPSLLFLVVILSYKLKFQIRRRARFFICMYLESSEVLLLVHVGPHFCC